MFFENNDGSFYIEDIFRVKRKDAKVKYAERDFTGISFRLSGGGIFKYRNKSISAEAGSISYIPSGIDFEIQSEEEDVIIVHLKYSGSERFEIEVVSPESYDEFASLFSDMERIWNGRRKGYRHRCTAVFYNMLERLEMLESALEDSRVETIRNGVAYMNAHFDRADLSIAELALKCNISEVYFRRLYKQVFGRSPLDAINALRVKNAQRLLRSGYYRVGEAASLSGFEDTRYFSTVFKKYTGVSPSAIIAGKKR